MRYDLLVEHLGHKLKVVVIEATEFYPKRARIICETCYEEHGMTSGLVEAIDFIGRQPWTHGKAAPKSDVQGGKAKK